MKKLIILLILSFAAISDVNAQYYEQAPQSGVGSPYFEFVIHRQYADDYQSNKLMMMSTFLYDDLTFVKSDTSGYDAEIEMILAIYDDNEVAIASRTINKSLNVKSFNNTNLRTEKLLLTTEFIIPAGEYTVLARVIDLNSRKPIQRKVEIKISDYSKNDIGISGIVFLQEAELDSNGKLINFQPTIGNNFTLRSGFFYIYFDLFVMNPPRNVNIRYQMENDEGDSELDSIVTHIINDKITAHLFRLEKNQFTRSSYNLVISVYDGKYKAEAKQKFSFFWSEVPGTVQDIDNAFDQMVYIINADSLDYYEEAGLEEKQAFFIRFWKDRDPDPATSINELKDEYFKRINFANAKFSAFGQKGWRTDRGRILIKFGSPDDIERRPFEIDSEPYEVWRYYTERKVFVFIDRTGFGDYRLHPNYINVEFE